MKCKKVVLVALLLAATLAIVPAASAQVTVHWIGAGSSAMFTGSGIAAANVLAGAGSHHYTVSGNCTGGGCAFINDGRPGSGVNETGNLWVTWNSTETEVWAYLGVDSTVGVRAFFSNPRPTLQLNAETNNGTKHGSNLLHPRLFTDGDATADASCLGLTTCDALSIPNAIFNALNGHVITAGLADTRAEDGQFAQCRLSKALTNTAAGLGYGNNCTQLLPTPIKSSFSSASQATPVAFSIKGKDPFSGLKIVKNYVQVNLGAAPIVFIYNRTGGSPAFGNFSNATQQNLRDVFGGEDCSTSRLGIGGTNKPVTAVLREPMSGTMNTTEYTTFRVYISTKAVKTSQELNVGLPTPGTVSNPLSTAGGIYNGGAEVGKPCKTVGGVTGHRVRAIGTGQMVSGASGVGGVKNIPDSIGYTFFSWGNVAPLANSASYGYIAVDGVEPIFTTHCSTDPCGFVEDPGQRRDDKLPACDVNLNGTAGTPAAIGGCRDTDVFSGNSFPNLRNGKYRAWSILRMFRDNGDTDAQDLADAMQEQVNNNVVDLVPFNDIPGPDPGLAVYRSFSKRPKSTPATPSNINEVGGDMGGCIFTGARSDDAAHLNLHQGASDGVHPPDDGGTCYFKAGLN